MAGRAVGSDADLIALDRYPVTDLESERARELIVEARRSLAAKGVAILPGFVGPEVLGAMIAEAGDLLPKAHREDISGSPYLELPDVAYPEGHPRRASVHSAAWVIAYDLFPDGSPLRRLYEWDPLMRFIGEVLERRPLYRFADPLGALNLALMTRGDPQGWHYDNTQFVVSLAIQSSEGGGLFECAPRIRSAGDENYGEVARVLGGEAPERLEIFPMTPGTLMIFEGRYSLHRVTPVQGERPRMVALLSYDTRPGTDSSDLFKLVRYGRTAPLGD